MKAETEVQVKNGKVIVLIGDKKQTAVTVYLGKNGHRGTGARVAVKEGKVLDAKVIYAAHRAGTASNIDKIED